ncbi:MAG: NAD(P)/FAD-dependent oxidoreductase [Gammaproteobacteria bacterium]|nr:NAD(P)/FAD-dependent oxidoreductase [Gammaproteobacteria bacterium]
MTQIYDYLVVGAGPAGMAAAIEASHAGLKVLVLDQAAAAGGQIFRNVGHSCAAQEQVLGPDYGLGKPLLQAFMAAPCDYRPLAQVWNIEPHAQGFTVAALIDGLSINFVASDLLIANGAMERPMAVSGWEKPGVMTAGAGQILLKASALVPKQVVLAGSGPLLLLLAHQYRAAGVTITALLDTTPRSNYWRAIPWLIAGLSMPKQLLKGVWLSLVQRIRVPYFTNVADIKIVGHIGAEAVRFTAAGKDYEVPTQLVLLHQGIVAQTQMAQTLACELSWNPVKQCWQIQTTGAGQTSVPGVQVAGDAGAIGGAQLAQLEGRLAAMARIERTGTRSSWAKKMLYQALALRICQLHWARGLVDRLYQPAPWLSTPTGTTLVCRCEQVSAAQITDIAQSGCAGVNQLKAFSRAGMGPCQGRQCGLNLGYLVAQAQGRPMAQVQPLSVRPPLSPINLGQLAQSSDL